MAYAILAGVEPVTGIYTGMWPVLVYVMLGNMAHVSMGTFAIISIMVNQVCMILNCYVHVYCTMNVCRLSRTMVFPLPPPLPCY